MQLLRQRDVAAMMMRAMVLAVVVAGLAGAACGPRPATRPGSIPPPAAASSSRASLATGAQEQRVVISPDRRFLEYTFTRNGTTTTARYALSEMPPEPALYFVTIRRPSTQADCAALAGRGPVIDAIEVKRGGTVISDARAGFSAASCGQPLNDKGPVGLNSASLTGSGWRSPATSSNGWSRRASRWYRAMRSP